MSKISEIQREAMIASQLVPNGIDDAGLVAAYRACARDDFLTSGRAQFAYSDESFLLEDDQRVLLAPMLEAHVLKAARLSDHDVVLLVGAFPGVMAQLAAHLASAVFALEDELPRVEELARIYDDLEVGNIIVEQGQLTTFRPKNPVDAIIFSGAVADVPPHYFDSLASGGRLVAILRPDARKPGVLTRFSKSDGGIIGREALREVYAPHLGGFKPKAGFTF